MRAIAGSGIGAKQAPSPMPATARRLLGITSRARPWAHRSGHRARRQDTLKTQLKSPTPVGPACARKALARRRRLPARRRPAVGL